MRPYSLQIPLRSLILSRLHDTSPVKGGGTEEEQFRIRRLGASLSAVRNEEDLIFRKWALMWRSVIMSTLDKTYLPYYSYVRYLDLDDLLELFKDSRFTGKTRELAIPLYHLCSLHS